MKAPTLTPTTAAVPYSTLRSLNWDVPTTRVSSTNNTAELISSDFFSLQCISFGQVAPDRKSCLKAPANGAGAVHVRYDCARRQFWVLTYTFADMPLVNQQTASWAVYECGAVCGGGDEKFIKIVPGSTGNVQTSAQCSNPTCPDPASCSAGQTSCWCCDSMWPITAAAPTGTNMIGWMARVNFTITGANTASWDAMMPHLDFSWSGTSNTGSSANDGTGNARVCFDCAGELAVLWLLPEKGCS